MELVLYYVLLVLLASLIQWVTLLIVVPIAQRLADFSMPPWPQTLGKLAVVALGTNVVTVALDPIHPFLGWVGGLVLFWVLLWRWFELDLFGAIIIAVVTWIVRLVLVGVLVGTLAGLF